MWLVGCFIFIFQKSHRNLHLTEKRATITSVIILSLKSKNYPARTLSRLNPEPLSMAGTSKELVTFSALICHEYKIYCQLQSQVWHAVSIYTSLSALFCVRTLHLSVCCTKSLFNLLSRRMY